jgi:glycosyltransferase involved in cell wall biosynthesis
MLARLGWSDRVHFVGEVTGRQKWSLLRSADLFVLPTHSENFGLVVAEALSAAVPVITTTGAPWSELHSERCGLWCDVGREPLRGALATALALDDQERHEMGRRGRQLVIDRYSWDRVCDMFHETYSWILGVGSKPGWVR